MIWAALRFPPGNFFSRPRVSLEKRPTTAGQPAGFGLRMGGAQRCHPTLGLLVLAAGVLLILVGHHAAAEWLGDAGGRGQSVAAAVISRHELPAAQLQDAGSIGPLTPTTLLAHYRQAAGGWRFVGRIPPSLASLDAAQAACRNKLALRIGGRETVFDFGPDIDWTPADGAAGEALQELPFWRTLAWAFRETNDAAFFEAWARQFRGWRRDRLARDTAVSDTQAARQSRVLTEALASFLAAPGFTPDLLVEVLDELLADGDALVRALELAKDLQDMGTGLQGDAAAAGGHPSRIGEGAAHSSTAATWRTLDSAEAVLRLALLLPNTKNAAYWQDLAVQTLQSSMSAVVSFDGRVAPWASAGAGGGSTDLARQLAWLRRFSIPARLARQQGQWLFAQWYWWRLEAMVAGVMHAALPGGNVLGPLASRQAALAGKGRAQRVANVAGVVARYAELFQDRVDVVQLANSTVAGRRSLRDAAADRKHSLQQPSVPPGSLHRRVGAVARHPLRLQPDTATGMEAGSEVARVVLRSGWARSDVAVALECARGRLLGAAFGANGRLVAIGSGPPPQSARETESGRPPGGQVLFVESAEQGVSGRRGTAAVQCTSPGPVVAMTLFRDAAVAVAVEHRSASSRGGWSDGLDWQAGLASRHAKTAFVRKVEGQATATVIPLWDAAKAGGSGEPVVAVTTSPDGVNHVHVTLSDGRMVSARYLIPHSPSAAGLMSIGGSEPERAGVRVPVPRPGRLCLPEPGTPEIQHCFPHVPIHADMRHMKDKRSSLVVVHSKRLLYCGIPKVGGFTGFHRRQGRLGVVQLHFFFPLLIAPFSPYPQCGVSRWRRLMRAAEGVPNFLDGDAHFPDRSGLVYGPDVEPAVLEAAANSYHALIIVRSPFARLLSAWLDKREFPHFKLPRDDFGAFVRQLAQTKRRDLNGMKGEFSLSSVGGHGGRQETVLGCSRLTTPHHHPTSPPNPDRALGADVGLLRDPGGPALRHGWQDGGCWRMGPAAAGQTRPCRARRGWLGQELFPERRLQLPQQARCRQAAALLHARACCPCR